jgi:ankyrin repeat protein
LESAVYSGNTDSVRQLLDTGADANQGGGTLLRLAAESGQTDVARMLVERGADVNAKTANGRTSLMVAAAFGQVDVVKLLLPKVTDINAMTTEKETALYMAVEENHPDVIEILLAAGADPAIGEVWTLAERAGRWETARMLRKTKPDHAAPARSTARQGDAAS